MDGERKGDTDEGKDGKKGGRAKGSSVLVPPPPAPVKQVVPPPQASGGGWSPGSGRKVDLDTQDGDDRKTRDKVREKRDNWKESWKDRWRKPEKVDENSRDTFNDVSGPSQVLSGGDLMNLLKADRPAQAVSARRYTREELMCIGQLPMSKVKPPTLDAMIDKGNPSSTLLLMKTKADKASRRRGDGDEDDGDDDDGAGRRERRSNRDRGARKGESEEEDENDGWADRRGRRGHRVDRDARWGGGWNQDEWTNMHQEFMGKGDPQHPSAGSWQRADPAPQWDMPATTGAEGSLWEFTLGDIRKAEKSIAGGMSMKDYKASLRSAGDLVPERKSSDPFQDSGDGNFFVEEDEEDVSRASRGFGKWFGAGRAAEAAAAAAAAAGTVGVEATSPSAQPAAQPVQKAAPKAAAAAPASPACASRAAAAPAAPVAPGIVSGRATSSTAPVSPGRQASDSAHRSTEAEATSSASAAAAAQQQRQQESRDSHEPGRVLPEAGATAGSNSAGRSILSMLARPADGASSSASASQDASNSGQGKLSVADLFQIAKGQQLPPIPPVNSAPPRNTGGAAQDLPENMAQTEALKMASQLMWAAAAKASERPAPAGSRYPGFQQPGAPPYNAVHSAGRGQMGRGHDASWEAYAQAAMSMGRGAYPNSAPSSGYPHYPGARGHGYGSQYGAYGAHDDFSAQMMGERAGDGNNDAAAVMVAAAQAKAQQAHAAQVAAARAKAQQAHAAQAILRHGASEFGGVAHLSGAAAAAEGARSPFQASPGLAAPRASMGLGSSAGPATGPDSGAVEAVEDDAGCSQS